MAEVDEMINAVERAISDAASIPSSKTNGDAGAANIRHAGGLSSNALREAFEECARRAIELADANLEQAKADKRAAEKFADEVREYGDRMAAVLEGGFTRASTMASTMASNYAQILPERGQ